MTKTEKQKLIDDFLRESNAIEGVYDDDSLHQAHVAWKYLIGVKILTPGVVLKTHKILMLHQPHLMPDEKGYFRHCGVRIGGRYGLDWQLVPEAVYQWCEKTMIDEPVDPIEMHIAYENIHPFVDGNGRTGRMLLNWTRVKRTKEPILVIKESERQKYYELFRQKINVGQYEN